MVPDKYGIQGDRNFRRWNRNQNQGQTGNSLGRGPSCRNEFPDRRNSRNRGYILECEGVDDKDYVCTIERSHSHSSSTSRKRAKLFALSWSPIMKIEPPRPSYDGRQGKSIGGDLFFTRTLIYRVGGPTPFWGLETTGRLIGLLGGPRGPP